MGYTDYHQPYIKPPAPPPRPPEPHKDPWGDAWKYTWSWGKQLPLIAAARGLPKTMHYVGRYGPMAFSFATSERGQQVLGGINDFLEAL
jgi:hypothetical protein